MSAAGAPHVDDASIRAGCVVCCNKDTSASSNWHYGNWPFPAQGEEPIGAVVTFVIIPKKNRVHMSSAVLKVPLARQLP